MGRLAIHLAHNAGIAIVSGVLVAKTKSQSRERAARQDALSAKSKNAQSLRINPILA